MTDKKIIAIISAIIVIVGVFAACNQHTNQVNSTTEIADTTAVAITEVMVTHSTETTVSQTAVETTSAETTESETKPVRSTTTTVKETTTHKATTTTEKSTTAKKETTTKKNTTTKKPETTTKKKETTTKAKTCTGNGNHSVSCGNMGRWFSSRSDVKAYVDKEMKYWADLEERGEITREEYYKKCPSGYECWSCSYCGKWTGNFTY